MHRKKSLNWKHGYQNSAKRWTWKIDLRFQVIKMTSKKSDYNLERLLKMESGTCNIIWTANLEPPNPPKILKKEWPWNSQSKSRNDTFLEEFRIEVINIIYPQTGLTHSLTKIFGEQEFPKFSTRQCQKITIFARFLVPQILTFFDTFFTAKIHREHDFCPVLFCTDLCAKIDVRMISYL